MSKISVLSSCFTFSKDLLKECFENIKGISEDSVVVCLRHVLRFVVPLFSNFVKSTSVAGYRYFWVLRISRVCSLAFSLES